jgi:imidazolonepropionase-like amidohydrolase
MIRYIVLLFFSCGQIFFVNAQYYLTHINILDVETGKIIRDQTLAVSNNHIGSISPASPDGTSGQVYDCSGKYVIPGLWDMHIHNSTDSETRFKYIPLFIANGVTGIRDMWGDPDMLRIKQDIDAGRFTGPRMIMGSPIIEGAKSFFRATMKAATVEQGRQLVDSFADAGYDFIKIYSSVREPVYLAIADECKKRKIPLEGHLPIEIGLEEALDAGQRSFEHNFNIDRYLTGKEAESILWARNYLDTAQSIRDGQFMIRTEPLGITEKNFHLDESLLEKMVSKRAAIVPTLTLVHGRGLKTEVMAANTKGLDYMDSDFVAYWKRQKPLFPEEIIPIFGSAVKFLINKGVLILAGTDVNNPFCVPGFGLHQELINLHDAGLTNLQVLQTATINPAKFLYQENQLGTVSVGKLADMVILDENPLTDIANTQKIYAVILNGKYFSREEIRRMLDSQKNK